MSDHLLGTAPVGTPGRLDSREIIARIGYLEGIDTDYIDGLSSDGLDDPERAELAMLLRFQEECESFPDWPYGATFVRDCSQFHPECDRVVAVSDQPWKEGDR